MSYLTSTFSQEIEGKLNTQYFLSEDFNIKTQNYSNYVLLTITYIYIQEYEFTGYVYKDEEKFSIKFSPGTITLTVVRNDLSKHLFMHSIGEWLNNIYTEMAKTPIARQVNDQAEMLKSFQEKIHSMGVEGEDYFTKEEGEELRQKLGELEELLKNSVIEKAENNSLKENELRKLKSEIEVLKNHLEVLNRKNWFLSFSARLFNWFRRNPELARKLAGFSREMLPQEAKDIVSQEALDQLLPPKSVE